MVKGTQRASRRSKTRKITTTNTSSNDPNNQSNHLRSSKDTKSKSNKRSLRRTQSSAKAHIFNTDDDKDQSKERQKSKERDKRKNRRKTKSRRVVEDQNEKDGVIQEIANEIPHDGQSNVTSHDDIQMDFSEEEEDLEEQVNLGDEAIHLSKRTRGRKNIEDERDEVAEGTETEGDETGEETVDETGTDETGTDETGTDETGTDESEGDESEEVDIEVKEDGSEEKSTFIYCQTVNCNCFD